MSGYQRKLPTTGYWIFVCNTNQWHADQWLALGEPELHYRISGHHQTDVRPGHVGLLRVNDDRRSAASRQGRPKLRAGVYAIFEVIGHPAFIPDPDTRHITDSDFAKPRWRVRVRVVANLLENPILATSLPDDADFAHIHSPLQTSTIPISEKAFRQIVSMAGYADIHPTETPPFASKVGPSPATISEAIGITKTANVFIANFGRENAEWSTCLERGTIATMNGPTQQGYWEAGDRDSYIEYCLTTVKTAAGIQPTRPVASRWFNLMTIVSETNSDLWIHREKNQLWWSISKSDPPTFEIEPDPFSTDGSSWHVCHKPCTQWSDKNLRGVRLDWNSIHPRAREFLFTEGTLQALSEDNAEYARALIIGDDLSYWHSRPGWTDKVTPRKGGPVRIYTARERTVTRMALTAQQTAKRNSGQQATHTLKNKEFEFSSVKELEEYILALIDAQEGLCAITGIQLEFDGEATDTNLLASLDRIDSGGHYARGNLQVVCQFINKWKSASDNDQFIRLIELVREASI